jgi:hypothetical protein
MNAFLFVPGERGRRSRQSEREEKLRKGIEHEADLMIDRRATTSNQGIKDGTRNFYTSGATSGGNCELWIHKDTVSW